MGVLGFHTWVLASLSFRVIMYGMGVIATERIRTSIVLHCIYRGGQTGTAIPPNYLTTIQHTGSS